MTIRLFLNSVISIGENVIVEQELLGSLSVFNGICKFSV